MKGLEPDLRLVPAVGLEMLGRDLQIGGHLGDRPESGLLRFGHASSSLTG